MTEMVRVRARKAVFVAGGARPEGEEWNMPQTLAGGYPADEIEILGPGADEPAKAGEDPADGEADGGEVAWASDEARALADLEGIDGRALTGTGAGGRIVAADVRAAAEARGGPVCDP